MIVFSPHSCVCVVTLNKGWVVVVIVKGVWWWWWWSNSSSSSSSSSSNRRRSRSRWQEAESTLVKQK